MARLLALLADGPALLGVAIPNTHSVGTDHCLTRTPFLPNLWARAAAVYGPLSGRHQLAGRTGSAAQVVVAAWGVRNGEGNPQRCKPTGWGHGQSSPSGGRCLGSANGGMQPPVPHALWLGGEGVLARRWSLLEERLRGLAAPSGAGPPARGRAFLCKPLVLPTVCQQGKATPSGACPLADGDAEPCPSGGPCLMSAYRG